MAHPAITLSGIAGKQRLYRSMTPGYGGDMHMLHVSFLFLILWDLDMHHLFVVFNSFWCRTFC